MTPDFLGGTDGGRMKALPTEFRIAYAFSMDTQRAYSLHIDFFAVLALDDLVARVCIDDGSEQRVVLRNGQFSGVFPARPIRLFLTTDSVPEGESPLVQRICTESPRAGGTGPLIEFEELFRIGMVIPVDGMLSARLIWGTFCHLHHGGTSLLERYNNPQTPADGGRFLGSEHIKCAERIGKDESRIRPLRVEGHKAFFNAETKLPCGPRMLTFGQILALGGDLYAFLDRDSLNDYTRSWPEPSGVTWLLDWNYREPPLLEDHSNAVEDTLATFERELAKLLASQDPGGIWDAIKDGATSEFPFRRYTALAAVNYCHFGAQPPNGTYDQDHNEALQAYLYYHRRALAKAEVAGMWPDAPDALPIKQRKLLEALVEDAFGCHFLTDLFASGHIRVPRRLLTETFGVVRGGLGMAKSMHEEDNHLGLWCTTLVPQSPRVVWRVGGDGELLKPENELHLQMVQESVRRSVEEVFRRYCGAAELPPERTAVALLPVPLAVGNAPLPSDVSPLSHKAVGQGPPNHYPRFVAVQDAAGRQFVAKRLSDEDPHLNRYIDAGPTPGLPFSLTL